MVKFEHNNGDLRCAVFGGNVTDLCADLCLQMSLIYGAMARQDKGLADTFRRNMILSVADKEIADKVFSTEIYDQIQKAESYATGTITVGDKEEFERQLKEIMKEITDENE